MKRKVLRLIPVLDFGGVESRFTLQAQLWSAPDIKVEYCTFWKLGAAAEQIRAAGATVHLLNENPSIRNPNATRALLALLRSYRPDVVHSSIGEANFHNMCCASFGPWKTIIEEAGIPNRTFRNRVIHAGLYRFCDRIIAVSPASADYLIRKEWAPKARVQVIPNAIRPEFFQAGSPTPLRNGPTMFRAVGRLTAVKNYPMLVRAFAKAHERNPNIRLEIVGEGEDRPLLESLIRELNAASFITLRGFVSDIVALHQDTDFFLMPSLSEGFGLAAAEPMAMGIPGLGSKVGGLYTVFGELAEDWLIAPQNESGWTARIVEVSKLNAEAYEELSKDFSATSKRFHPTRYVDTLAHLYRSSVSKM